MHAVFEEAASVTVAAAKLEKTLQSLKPISCVGSCQNTVSRVHLEPTKRRYAGVVGTHENQVKVIQHQGVPPCYLLVVPKATQLDDGSRGDAETAKGPSVDPTYLHLEDLYLATQGLLNRRQTVNQLGSDVDMASEVKTTSSASAQALMQLLAERSFRCLARLQIMEVVFRGPKDHMNRRILQTMVSGIPLVPGLGTRM